LNPWTQTPGDRLYRSGVFGRYRPDGAVEGLGRADTRVKVRGHRIELGEIEARLHQHPAVQEVAVLVREDVPGKKCLAAYVVPKHEAAPTVRELRRFLGEQLPAYMIPSVFVSLPALPLTPNGKIDRIALPAPAHGNTSRDGLIVAPYTEIEEVLTEIWRQVLKRDQISIHENFFDLGGHSLLATQLVARICATWQLEVPLRALFEAPTIAELGDVIEEILVQEIERLTEGAQQ
jgi:hypothetical protein